VAKGLGRRVLPVFLLGELLCLGLAGPSFMTDNSKTSSLENAADQSATTAPFATIDQTAAKEEGDWIHRAAEASIGESVQGLTTEHYRVYIDGDSIATGRAVLNNLESLWRFYEATVGGLIPLNSSSQRTTLFYFTGPGEMERFIRGRDSLSQDAVAPGVLMSPRSGYLAFDASGILGRADLSILLHSVAHLSSEQLLHNEGIAGSWWVREGLAVYFMQTPLGREGEFQYGQIRRDEAYIRDVSPGGRAADGLTFSLKPKSELKKTTKAYKKKHHIPLRVLLEHPADKPWPDTETRNLASMQSWILVHFLLHGSDGDLRPRLSEYLELERQGLGGVAAFRKTVAGDLEAFEFFVQQHIKSMR